MYINFIKKEMVEVSDHNRCKTAIDSLCISQVIVNNNKDKLKRVHKLKQVNNNNILL